MRKLKLLCLFLFLLCLIETSLLIVFFRKLHSLKTVSKKIIPRIAIVIDDWGYSLENINFLEEITTPLNIAILPNLTYSQQIAKFAHERGKEILLHLPLEPYPEEKVLQEKYTIDSRMSNSKIRALFYKALNSVPYAKGVSNHMGSKSTEEEKLMKYLFKLFKEKRLYFLDSLVTPKSVCKTIAKEMKIKFIQRDVFLDNQRDSSYIQSQFELLIRKAKIKGKSVGVLHAHKFSLKILKDIIPDLKGKVKFVFLSEIVE